MSFRLFSFILTTTAVTLAHLRMKINDKISARRLIYDSGIIINDGIS